MIGASHNFFGFPLHTNRRSGGEGGRNSYLAFACSLAQVDLLTFGVLNLSICILSVPFDF